MKALLLAGAVMLGSAGAAQATVVVTYSEVGGSVLASGSGTINTSGLTYNGLASGEPGLIWPSNGLALIGAPGDTDLYAGITGPANFGPGGTTLPTTGTGSLFGLQGNGGTLFLPRDYVSNSALSSTESFIGKSFSSLGLTPGTYIYNFGSGANADTFTLQIGPVAAAVPEPPTLALLATGVLGIRLNRRRNRV